MQIWHKTFTLAEINQRGHNTLAHFLDIEFIEIGADYLVAQMPVADKVKQPIGIVHGGANVVLAETVASTAANMVIDLNKFYCVGLEINMNHLRAKREGIIRCITKPYHLGRSTQVWDIELRNESNQLTAISRMTASVLKRVE
jgi:1,4-dihydroxy-2-naphthoyl-CoA hydrolase